MGAFQGGGYHNEHQVGQLLEGLVLPKRLDQGGEVLLGVGARHGQDDRLPRVLQELEDALQPRMSHSDRVSHYVSNQKAYIDCSAGSLLRSFFGSEIALRCTGADTFVRLI